jgi:hypothetical protein
MRHRFTSVVILLSATLLVAADAPRSPGTLAAVDPDRLVVHEWGTFTSVAAADGTPVEWLTPNGPQDLPCFVDRMRSNIKGWLHATVRMETPVLYFYSARERTVDVGVRFRNGIVTEWYPKAQVTPESIELNTLRNPALEGTARWSGVRVRPGAAEKYPVEPGENHYYAARATDASPIEVGDQREKFLFYRGVGNFPLPIQATLAPDGRVVVTAAKGQPVGDLMLFENTGKAVRHDARRSLDQEVTFPRPGGDTRTAAVTQVLERMLIAHGLYAKEAAAMIETWRDSWFEEGLRLFYIVPQATIDSVLPLEMTPAPAEVARVFVGRIELITPAIVNEVKRGILERDAKTIARHHRFLRPIYQLVLATSTPAEQSTIERNLQYVQSAAAPRAAACR